MTRAVWLSDIHLDSCNELSFESLLTEVLAANPSVVLLGGDISNAKSIEADLARLASTFEVPLYFVLGNHDFYLGSFDSVNARVRAICAADSRLVYLLDQDDPIALTEGVGLVGCGDWADGRLGDYRNSRVLLNDFRLIEDLTGLSRQEAFNSLNRLGDVAARRLDRRLARALDEFDTTIILLHVPPFREAAWYEREPSNDEFLPFFACKAVGEVLLKHFEGHADRRGLALCGHTHGQGVYRPLPNLEIRTAGAEYGQPCLQGVLDLTSPASLFD